MSPTTIPGSFQEEEAPGSSLNSPSTPTPDQAVGWTWEWAHNPDLAVSKADILENKHGLGTNTIDPRGTLGVCFSFAQVLLSENPWVVAN